MNDGRNGSSENQVVYELRNLTKAYNGRTVLEIEHLQVGKGEILALVGPSGSGKSTLLRLLNFLEPPSGGFLSFQGKEILSGPGAPLELRRRVTMVFQRPMLLDRSVEENVAFGLQLRGRRNNRDLVQAALKDVGLESLARQRARTLSGGEAQRVALARAIVLKPDVLLLDEPTANLDPYNVSLIENIVRRLHEEQGTTIVLVTHNVFQARRLAQRVAFLLEGRVVEIAPVTTFFESPQDARTAAFVRGDMVY
ncbi:MAG: phosphate ABC transporter ATP-binding protein [Chloroflexi bacterium]|jgi:tungstate transport system ATP-binding protein|nr:phosphate ABC transporter ATP-binding protein [Chloroflexota bacterium]